MRVSAFVLIIAFASPAWSDDFWSAAELDEFAVSLADDVGANNSAVLDRIIDHGSYFAAIVHREPGPGFSESHEEWADVYFVSSGKGTLVTGGTIPDGTETDPGEIRGTVIEGGTARTIAEGDVVHIPAGMPHHVMVADGDQITYYILKLKVED
ncbi:MAG: cupin domain-containing protein [Gammaproteobacteria bacterium]|jgi:mannose-6-phosphate isomerase-like protein (cupin superfamily)